jgi:protein-disulfide isomerase
MRVDGGQLVLTIGVAAATSLAVVAATVGLKPDGAQVRAYLLAHPEVIPEAIGALEARDSGKAVAANRRAIETPVGDAWLGNPNADVTVVEFFDYNCGYCRASLPVIAALVKADPKVKVVFRELPILSQASYDAAKLSYAAARQGKFRAFHDPLYAAGRVTLETLAATAKAAGVDLAAAKATEAAAEAEVKRNVAIARDLKTSGTPTFVVGDRVLIGMQTLDQLTTAIKAARATN